MSDKEYRYLKNAEHFLNEICVVWSRHFQSATDLRHLFQTIATDEEKDIFLRVGAFYRYLVIEGSFRFDKEEWGARRDARDLWT